MHGARPFIYIGLHRALKIVAKKNIITFIPKSLETVLFLCTFEPRICKRAILTAVSMSTL